jgi:hypothetical protein
VLSGDQDKCAADDAGSTLMPDIGFDGGGIETSAPGALSNGLILAKLFNLLPDADRCEGDSYIEDDDQGLLRLFRAGGEGQGHMNKELFERLELGEKFDIEDFLLLSTLMGQQQDPNATNNLLNVLILSKLLGRGGSGRGIETALLLSQMMNTNAQAASGGTGGLQPAMQNNMLPLLLALSMGRGEEWEGGRGMGRRGWRDKDDYPEAAAPEKKQPRQ